jgi:hypothetical protein
MSIAGGALSVAGGKTSPAWADPDLYLPAIARTPGTVAGFQKTMTLANAANDKIGLSDSSSGNFSAYCPQFNMKGIGGWFGNSQYTYWNATNNGAYNVAFALRTQGYFPFMKGDGVASWRLMDVPAGAFATTTTPLYPAYVNYNSVYTSDYFRVATAKWLPTPLASDGFGTFSSGEATAITNRSYAHTVTVTTTIAAALASITDASATNTYKIYVPDGTYAESNLQMKNYVDLVGQSRAGTIIATSDAHDNILTGGINCMISNLTVNHTANIGANTYYPIHMDAGANEVTTIIYNVTTNALGSYAKSGIGIGAHQAQNIYLINSSFSSAALPGIFAHNTVNDSSSPWGMRLNIVNCTGTGSNYGIDWENLGSGMVDIVNIYGGTFSGGTYDIYGTNNGAYPNAVHNEIINIDPSTTYSTSSFQTGITVTHAAVPLAGFGTTDGFGHAEEIGVGAGGSGNAWSSGASTWSVFGGTAINTSPSGISQQLASVSTSTPDVLVSVAPITNSGGEKAGVVTNLDSVSNPQNYVLAYTDGTNCKLDKVVGGTLTNVISAACTFSGTPGALLTVIKDGTKYLLIYNGAKIGSTATISDAGIINNTKHGIFSTSVVNHLDNFSVYARGTSNEYSTLDSLINRTVQPALPAALGPMK